MVEKVRADVRVISQAVEMYRLDQMKYPTMEQGIESLAKAPEGNSFRNEGYIRALPKDPWGQDYQYLIPGEHSAYDVFSFGADGRIGGEGLNADIGNWSEGS